MAEQQFHDRAVALDQAQFVSDGLTIEGYAAVFNQRAEVSDWKGSYWEEYAPGAFAETIRMRGPAKVRMQFQHGFDPAFGVLPIGVWEDFAEDSYGLHVRGRLHDTWHTAPLRAAIESGAVDGMSIRMRVVSETRIDNLDKPLYRLNAVSLTEAGPVVGAVYEGTAVAVRAHEVGLELCRAIMRGEQVDVSGHAGIVPAASSEKAEAAQPVLVTRAERRKYALRLRGVTHEPPGAAA